MKGEINMKKYYIDYNTGAGNEYAETLEEAKALADEGACYTQESIYIYEVDEEKETKELVSLRNWNGVAYDEDEDSAENPICFGDFGYFDDWNDL